MATTRYIWNRDKVAMEKDGTGTTNITFTQGTSQYGPLVSDNSGVNSQYYHYDALGSTRVISDENETVTNTIKYDAWGKVSDRTGESLLKYLFVGKYGYHTDDNTSIIFVRRRLYSSANASWLAIDPNYESSPNSDYQYSSNSPVNFIDPSGLAIVVPVCCYYCFWGKDEAGQWLGGTRRTTIKCDVSGKLRGDTTEEKAEELLRRVAECCENNHVSPPKKPYPSPRHPVKGSIDWETEPALLRSHLGSCGKGTSVLGGGLKCDRSKDSECDCAIIDWLNVGPGTSRWNANDWLLGCVEFCKHCMPANLHGICQKDFCVGM